MAPAGRACLARSGGRPMTFIPTTITAELMEHADGRPVAYIDATGIAVFACQQPDGTYVIDICTRDDTAGGRLRLFSPRHQLRNGPDPGLNHRPQGSLAIASGPFHCPAAHPVALPPGADAA